MWRVWKTRSTRNLVYMPRQHLGAGKLTSWLEWSRAISMMTLWTWQRNSRRCCCGTLAFCRRVAPKFFVGNVGQRCQQLLLLLVVTASPQMMLRNVLSVGLAVDTSCNWQMLASHGRHFGQVSPVATLRSSTCSYVFFFLSLLLVLAIPFPRSDVHLITGSLERWDPDMRWTSWPLLFFLPSAPLSRGLMCISLQGVWSGETQTWDGHHGHFSSFFLLLLFPFSFLLFCPTSGSNPSGFYDAFGT